MASEQMWGRGFVYLFIIVENNAFQHLKKLFKLVYN